ncbi:MAG: hypothetical protein PF487_08865 [Bacteroidales bacterium]|jgi:hypothetical protein|nr:hypothetical protein [Bacteroidales bacterium]
MKYISILRVSELIDFCKEDARNIGITKSGEIYRYDFEQLQAIRVSFEDAKEELGLDNETMLQIVNSGGTYIVPTPIVEPVSNEVSEVKNENDEDEEEEDVVHENEPPVEEVVEEKEPVKCDCGCDDLREELKEYIEKHNKLQAQFDELLTKILL